MYFRSRSGNFSLPIFFPDATKGFVRAVDSRDILESKIPGLLVNTLHLYSELGYEVLKKIGGIRRFMNWEKALISDSGGFQVMSLIKKREGSGKVTNDGMIVKMSDGKKITLTPEESIRFQMELKTDLVVVLDDFTDVNGDFKSARESVERTILWAQRSKGEFVDICRKKRLGKDKKPYLIGVVQGGRYPELRRKCAEELVKIGFDGLGYGGWPITDKGDFDYQTAKIIAEAAPKNYLLYGLGIGKPQEIVSCVKIGYHIFDCVLPTRDARHKRLYIFNADSINKIDLKDKNFYSYYIPDKKKYLSENKAVSHACDCLLCKNYSRAYLAHLFRSHDSTSMRLATIHNLRFYSILMEKLRKID